MKVILKRVWVILIPLLLANCANAQRTAEIQTCPKNTQDDPVSFLYAVLDKRGLPIDVVKPQSNKIVSVDFKNSKHNLVSVLLKDHEIRQETVGCWQAVVADDNSANGYRIINKKIAILWSPFQKITFRTIVTGKIPKNSPVDIAYKYTIATEASNPSKPQTYLDPRIVTRIRM